MIEVDGVRVQRALVTELAHELVHRDELKTASHLLAGLASGDPSITLSEHDRRVISVALETPPVALEMLRDALIGNTAPGEETPGRKHADHM